MKAVQKIVDVFKNNKFAFLSFFLPILFLFLFFFVHGIEYKDLFTSDLGDQYLSFFYYLKDVFNGTSSLFFSFSKGLGESMLGTFLYYLTSPFNILLIFIPKNFIPLFMQMLILFKISLSAFTIYFLFRRITNKDGIFLSFFSFTYAVMGYTIFYYFNIMWLDLLYLSPLVLLGIHKIIEDGKYGFYIFFLFLSMVSNCYIAYMLCIFCFFYFLYQLFLQNVSSKRKVFARFLLASFISAFLSSFILIPMVLELKNIYREDISFSFFFSNLASNFFHFFQSFFIRRVTGEVDYWHPNMYFSLFHLFLLVLYFGNHKVSTREKKITFLFLLLFFLPYIVPLFNYIWHGFSVPVVLNYRFSFLVTIFMLLISIKSFLLLEKSSRKELIVFSFFLFFVFLLSTFFLEGKVSMYTALTNLFFLVSYAFLIFILSHYKSFLYKMALFFVVFLEIFVYMKNGFSSRKSLLYPYTLYEEKYDLCFQINDQDPNYRIDGKVISVNENLICNKGKVSEFNTMNHRQKYMFFKNSGFLVGSSFITSFFTYPPLYSSLMGVKYIYTDEPVLYGYDFLSTFEVDNKKYSIYENKNVLPIGLVFDEHSYTLPTHYNPFLYQNAFVTYLTGEEVFVPISYEKIDDRTFKMKINNRFPIYLNYMDRYDMDFYIDGKKIDTHKEMKEKNDMKQGILYIENQYYHKEVTVCFSEKIDYDHLFLYFFDTDKYEKAISLLKEDVVHISSLSKNVLKGEVNVQKDRTVLFTIPYSKKYKVFVDGKPTHVYSKFDTFIGFDVKKGKHDIQIIYDDKTLFFGIFVSFFSLFFLLFLRKKKIL